MSAATWIGGPTGISSLCALLVVLAGADPKRPWTGSGGAPRSAAPADLAGSSAASPERSAVTSLRSGHRRAAIVVTAIVGFVLALVVVGVGHSAALAGAAVCVRAHLIHSDERRRLDAMDRVVPELVDLFVIAASAGHPVHRCVYLVAGRAPPPLRSEMARACARLDRGTPLKVVLDELGTELGTLGPGLADALIDGHVTGTPVLPALVAVAITARDRRRRQAEASARRLPVTLLFPLVSCILPAVVLLAVVPLLAASLQSLQP